MFYERPFYICRKRAFTKTVALLILGLFSLLQAVSISHELHHWLHEDSDLGAHYCAAILLAKGLVDAASTEVAFVVPSAEPPLYLDSAQSVFTLIEYRLLPGRAPPTPPFPSSQS